MKVENGIYAGNQVSKAREHHKCAGCWATISPGDLYAWQFQGTRIGNKRLCETCAGIKAHPTSHQLPK